MSGTAIQSLSLDARVLYERLARSEMGEVLTYAELSALVARDVQHEGRGILETARRKAFRDRRFVFGTVFNVGLKRFNDLEKIGTGEHTIGKIRRLAVRGYRVATSIDDFDALPNEAKVRHNACASLTGSIALFTKNSAVKKLEAAVEKAGTTLPLAGTLEAFRG